MAGAARFWRWVAAAALLFRVARSAFLLQGPHQPPPLLISVIADFITALLLRATGQNLQLVYTRFLRSKKLLHLLETSIGLDSTEHIEG